MGHTSKSCEQFQSMAVPFNNNQPSLTRWPWAACHDLSEATGFHQRILVVLESSTLEIQEIWEPQIWHVGLTWREFADNEKRAWKKDGSQTSSTKIVLSYHDYIWLSCHLGMGETQVTRRMDGYKQKNTALAYPSHCKIYRRPLKSSNISCSI